MPPPPRHRRTVCHVSSPLIARVEPLTTTRRLSGPFDYRVDDDVEIGSIVKIPFGHQKLEGVVIRPRGDHRRPRREARHAHGIRDDSLPRDLVDLALWMAEEYCSTPARALALVTPPPGKAKTYLWAEPTGADGKLTDKQRALLATAAGPDGQGPARTAATRGARAGDDHAAGRAAGAADEPGAGPRASSSRRRKRMRCAAIEAAPGEARLLHGVTGSGKTEVYLRAAAKALERDEGVIVLVPEIALTPQTVARFAARFGDTVALLHSALSDGERYDEWRRLRSGEARIAVGPRSAVFAPVENLGLIVVDEEHDASYKHEGDPRYDARHVAEYRAYQTERAAARRLGDAAAGDRPPDAAAAASRARGRRRASCRPCACSTCASPSTRSIPRRGARSRPRASRSCC